MTKLYEVLGVSSNATQVEIKKAYRKLALQHHPDKVSDESLREESEVRFKEITAAYEILSDEERRSRYDTYGDHGDGSDFFNGQQADFEDAAFMNFFHNFGADPSSSGYGNGYGSGTQTSRSDDIQIPLNVSMADCYNGKSFKFQSKRNVVCDRCQGSGWRRRNGQNVPPPQVDCKNCNGQGFKQRIRRLAPGFATTENLKCTVCDGKGKCFSKPNSDKNKCKKCVGVGIIKESKPLTVSIPRGSRQGDQIVLEGEADQEIGKRETGDLVFIIEESTDSPEGVELQRHGSDLVSHLTISLAEAITGFDKILTRTLDGRILRINVPSGRVIRPGNIIKVSQEGWPVGSAKFGDLYVIVHIEFPPDNWFSERSDLLQIRNVLPGERKNNQKHIEEDPGNTETITNMTIVEDLPDFSETNQSDNFNSSAQPDDIPGCAQQ